MTFFIVADALLRICSWLILPVALAALATWIVNRTEEEN